MIQKSFNEVVLFARTGLNPRKNFQLGHGNNKYITIKNIHNNALVVDENTDVVNDDAIKLIHRRSQIKKGDVLFCSIGRMGDMYILEEDPIGWDINESVFAFTLDTNVIRQKYFYYIFKNRNTLDFLSKNSSGSTFKSIKMNQLKKMTFNLPTLEEQDLIVGILDKTVAVIDARNSELEALDQLVKARFVEMFGELDLAPQKQEWVPIFEIGEVVGGSTPKTSVPEYWDGEFRWLSPAELQLDSGIIYDSEKKITQAGINSCSLKEMPVGTVILSSRAPIGKVAIAGNSFYCNQGFKNIICNERVLPRYLYSLLLFNTDYLNSLGRGATFKEISKSIVESIRIPIPSIEEQIQFELFVEQVNKSKV